MYHFGVIKALWKQRLLPRVISGSSAGSIVSRRPASHGHAPHSLLSTHASHPPTHSKDEPKHTKPSTRHHNGGSLWKHLDVQVAREQSRMHSAEHECTFVGFVHVHLDQQRVMQLDHFLSNSAGSMLGWNLRQAA
jgi:hypothetical protein